MMPPKNLLYLLQLEEYDSRRFKNWLKNNPDRIVSEKKGALKWTPKARALFWLAGFFNAVSLRAFPDRALLTALFVLSPFDRLIKNLSVRRARLKIKKFKNLIVIGITGSYGKTTVKDAIAHILASKYRVLKTEGNYNTLLGVAKTIDENLRPEHEIFVCEMAAYGRGDIAAIAELAKPRIGVITAVGPMHFERFGSMENILKTKMELIESLPADGAALLPRELENEIKNFVLRVKPDFFESKEDLLEKIGKKFGLDEAEIAENIKTMPPTPHRREIIKASGGITIIDDTYNSNPAGFAAALETLKNIGAERKIIVTPGMVELGEKQFELNKEAALRAASAADYAIVVGETNKAALEEGFKAGLKNDFDKKIFWAKDLDSAKSKLSEIAVANSAVLLENDLPDNYF